MIISYRFFGKIFHVQLIAIIGEIIAATLMIDYFLSFFWTTRAINIFLFAFTLCLLSLGAEHLEWISFSNMSYLVLSFTLSSIPILFQQELRIALTKSGNKHHMDVSSEEFETFLEGLSHAVFKMAAHRVGALIIIENQDSQENVTSQSVILQAQFSQELLETIFYPGNPLHDGAVIIRDLTIFSARAILPLANDLADHTLRSMGTRHRAGIGISQQTDGLVIIVSEETGRVSIVKNGTITTGIKPDRFRAFLRSILSFQ